MAPPVERRLGEGVLGLGGRGDEERYALPGGSPVFPAGPESQEPTTGLGAAEQEADLAGVGQQSDDQPSRLVAEHLSWHEDDRVQEGPKFHGQDPLAVLWEPRR